MSLLLALWPVWGLLACTLGAGVAAGVLCADWASLRELRPALLAERAAQDQSCRNPGPARTIMSA